MKVAMLPLKKLFGAVVSVRNVFYDKGWVKEQGVSVPVVSVGNLTVGGTGKTPTLKYCVQTLLNKGVAVGVVSRGYKGHFKGVQRVHLQKLNGAFYYGDEPFMLASSFPGVPVYVGSDRVLAAQKLLEENPQIQVILADDAFQHRRLKRDLNIVVLDATVPQKDYELLPYGRAREPLTALNRADLLILNKVNLISKPQKRGRLLFLKEYLQRELPFVEGGYKIEKYEEIFSGEEVDLSQKEVVLVSGIGQPSSFKELVRKDGLQVEHHFAFPDHSEFEEKDLQDIISYCEQTERSYIVVTEKDAVKLRLRQTVKDSVLVKWVVAHLSLFFEKGQEILDEHLQSLV
ncbi:MAG: tetraacyldisaccharide 4'-kinase [Bdellovibrio sp.]|nr:MAG: tetraacyldisaccharide 4'-kinase [Bdellovibrio sp.]